MKYIIIGLGIYGSNLSLDLTALGHEIVGVDIKAANVEAIKDYISDSFIMDSTDEHALSSLPLSGVDIVIVAIGENFGASVKTVALLKKLKVKTLYARAVDALHQSILEGLNVDRILKPEQRAAQDLAHEMEFGSEIESMEFAADWYVMSFKAPKFIEGMHYADLNLEKRFGLQLISVSRVVEHSNFLGFKVKENKAVSPTEAGLTVMTGDNILCGGTTAAFKSLMKALKN